MEYRTFGRSDWKVSEIGFGGWQLGGTWGKVDDNNSVETLLYAFENGVNFVDTAFAYGNGHSERVIGKALNEWGSGKIYVATKITPIMDKGKSLNLDNNPSIKDSYPNWHIREIVEGSLKRLGVEQIDLIQLHLWFEDGIINQEWLETLNELKKEGKINKIGVSLADIRPNQGLELAKKGLVDSIQVLFNMFEQEPVDSLFPESYKTGTAIITRVPLDSGALTGTWAENTITQWAENDKRRLMYRGNRFKETLERVEKLKSLCKPFYPTLAEAALRYSLYPKEVAVVIPGMRNKREVELNLAISDGNNFNNELAEILRPYRWKHEFYN
ncbi:aldo/keto reductase [Arenibacter troitsensis]|uniref:Predicted oxidoreductase n=1 Tax=Arenibacter troitsensis TaxID=188872 RepID=A0A1X7IH61_9FLAO|nr:aldo/keto reductase [Arenibacter troitsensis]SMG13758.1 Predicted oxidoreductase [Arenibacter troitsensis]